MRKKDIAPPSCYYCARPITVKVNHPIKANHQIGLCDSCASNLCLKETDCKSCESKGTCNLQCYLCIIKAEPCLLLESVRKR